MSLEPAADSWLFSEYEKIKPRLEQNMKEVWQDNLEIEMKFIREIVKDYPYISIYAIYPGTVARPLGVFKSPNHLAYETLRVNAKLLGILQLGLTFMNKDGAHPPGCSTWQFNFKFDYNHDMCETNSVDILKEAGMNFDQMANNGVDEQAFAELLMMSNVVLNEEVKLIGFNTACAFAYIFRTLTCKDLPKNEKQFFRTAYDFFPKMYDIKHLCFHTHNTIQSVAYHLQIPHSKYIQQSGLNAQLIAAVFTKLGGKFYCDPINYSAFDNTDYSDDSDADDYCEPSPNLILDISDDSSSDSSTLCGSDNTLKPGSQSSKNVLVVCNVTDGNETRQGCGKSYADALKSGLTY